MKKSLAASSLVLVLAATLVAVAGSANDATYAKLGLFTEALDIIRRQYVDELPVEKLMHDAIAGTLSDLDPESVFVDAEHVNEWRDTGRAGIGAALMRRNEILSVVTPIDGTPAALAGLRPGDRVVKIDGAETRALALWQAQRRLRGDPGTKVTLNIAREGWAEPRDFTIERTAVAPKSTSTRDLGNGVAYVRISELRETTPGEIDAILAERTRAGLKGVVLDVRDSPRGDAKFAAQVAGLFLGDGEVAARTKSRAVSGNGKLLATAAHVYRNTPLSVLVNHGTEAGTEILAGALQDAHRGVLVGTKTFGHAAVESVLTLPDGAIVQLATGRYLTPSGRLIEGNGITPDVIVELKQTAGSDQIPSPPTAESDLQLQRAIDVLKIERVVGSPSTPAASESAATSGSR